ITGVITSVGMLQADAYVAALGSWSPRMLKPIGISVPVYPVKGYSITVPVIDPDGAPVSTVMDESYKVAITRLGNRIRVGGTAEISGYSDRLDALQQSASQHRPRHARMDHGLRLGKGAGGSDVATEAGYRRERVDCEPVRS